MARASASRGGEERSATSTMPGAAGQKLAAVTAHKALLVQIASPAQKTITIARVKRLATLTSATFMGVAKARMALANASTVGEERSVTSSLAGAAVMVPPTAAAAVMAPHTAPKVVTLPRRAADRRLVAEKNSAHLDLRVQTACPACEMFTIGRV